MTEKLPPVERASYHPSLPGAPAARRWNLTSWTAVFGSSPTEVETTTSRSRMTTTDRVIMIAPTVIDWAGQRPLAYHIPRLRFVTVPLLISPPRSRDRAGLDAYA